MTDVRGFGRLMVIFKEKRGETEIRKIEINETAVDVCDPAQVFLVIYYFLHRLTLHKEE